jgi:hypothetical protein
MKSFVSKGTLAAAVFVAAMLVAVFFVGAHHGYDIGYKDGEKRANGWWIDKKSRYYESAEIRKKRINHHHNVI